jgi:hypothetical protein
MKPSANDSRGCAETPSLAAQHAAIQSVPALPDEGRDFSAFIVDRKGSFRFLDGSAIRNCIQRRGAFPGTVRWQRRFDERGNAIRAASRGKSY